MEFVSCSITAMWSMCGRRGTWTNCLYTVADTQVRADAIAAIGVAEPNGILRCMQKAVTVDA